jgi:DNA-binding NarL/FixJ family response regulator
MDPPRVFLICVNRLVCEAVNVLLRREGIELLGMETDPEAALAQIRALRPDIVLVEGDDASSEVDLTGLARLVYEDGNLRVIRLSLLSEQLRIYHQEQRRLVNTQDLVAAIRAPL